MFNLLSRWMSLDCYTAWGIYDLVRLLLDCRFASKWAGLDVNNGRANGLNPVFVPRSSESWPISFECPGVTLDRIFYPGRVRVLREWSWINKHSILLSTSFLRARKIEYLRLCRHYFHKYIKPDWNSLFSFYYATKKRCTLNKLFNIIKLFTLFMELKNNGNDLLEKLYAILLKILFL